MMQSITRREALTRIAALGGSAPFIKAMGALGLMSVSGNAYSGAVCSDLDDVPGDIGKGKTVAIIGAGLSGLVTAYELSGLGFECHVFEADKRAKGRTFTVRPDGGPDSYYQEVGRAREVCAFDEVDGPGSLYFEAGAGRIPSHHRTVLHYCRQFDVPLESYIFASRQNLVRSDDFNDGKPVQLRRFKHNLRGYLAEMFRTADSSRLDGMLSEQERRQLMDELSQSFGQLDEQFEYHGGARAGYQPPGPGAGNQQGEYWKPFAFADLLQGKSIWKEPLYNDMFIDWQTSLMQPKGGIDNIAAAFLRQPVGNGQRVGNRVRLQRKVVSVEVASAAGKVGIIHQGVDTAGNPLPGSQEQFIADYCVSTIAPSLLHAVRNNFDADFSGALLNGVSNVPACKVAWQCDRFWEGDDYAIYGGISWTSDPISQIWYPSTGFHNQRGILTGGYANGVPNATVHFGDLSRAERIKTALVQGIKLHPELDPRYGYHDVSKALTIAWHNMPFQAGGWFEATEDQRQCGYQVLLRGQGGRLFMGGDAMSYLPGWMEGALSAGRMAACNVVDAVRSPA